MHFSPCPCSHALAGRHRVVRLHLGASLRIRLHVPPRPKHPAWRHAVDETRGRRVGAVKEAMLSKLQEQGIEIAVLGHRA
eukprot:1202243-Rhodomonas_salina.1